MSLDADAEGAAPLQSIDRLHRLALIGLAVIAVITVVGAFALESATRWVMHTRDVLRTARMVQLEMHEIEATTAVALASTGRAAVDASTAEAFARVEARFDTLLLQTQDNPAQVERVRAARLATADWRAMAATVSDVRSIGRFDDARIRMGTAFDALMDAEQTLYLQRVAAERRWRVALLVALLTAVGVLWFAVGRFVRTTRRQQSRIIAARDASLRASERLAFVLNSSPLALAIIDRDDRVDVSNTAWDALAEAGATGPRSIAAAAPSVAPQLLPMIDAVRQTGRLETREIAAAESAGTNGSPVTRRVWSATVYPLAGAELDALSVGIALLDVTAQRQLEEQYRQAQRMEAIGRLAGGIAHDFNNILTAITGFSELAASSLPEDGRAQSDLKQVRRAADRAAMLTRQLLAFSRQQVLQPRRLNLGELMRDMETMLRRLIGSHIVLQTRREPDLWPIFADPGQVEQVIVNLAINARDAMPNGGRLEIETHNVTLSPDPGASPSLRDREGDHVVIRMTDTGTGMTDQVRERIFEPFFTTKAVGHGTGLGLATVLGIVQQSGGAIDVRSEVGIGSSFMVYLPRASGASDTGPSEQSSTATIRGHGTVLVVEDDADVRQLTRDVLEQAGYTVILARNGLEGLERFDASTEPVRLVITDLVMPSLGGRALAERITARSPSTPILFMSGYAADASNQQTVLPGDAAFLEKPFTPTRLLDAVARAVAAGPGSSVPPSA